MKRIDIKITKAEILGFSVEFEDGKPEILATIACYAENGKQVTTFSVTTKLWSSEIKFNLPLDMIQPIIDIGMSLETIVVRECNKQALLIEAPK